MSRSKLIAAHVFLRRLIIDLHSTNLMVIAFGADAFFWVVGEIDCSCSLGAAVFRLFGHTAVCRTMASAAVMAITKSMIWAQKKGPLTKYQWDYANRLIALGVSTTYAYDAFGARVLQIGPCTTNIHHV